jgi:hypothetical protein
LSQKDEFPFLFIGFPVKTKKDLAPIDSLEHSLAMSSSNFWQFLGPSRIKYDRVFSDRQQPP